MAASSRGSRRSRWLAFGPGLLFAGAAVGVSHVVQSTRGGAEFGLVAVVIVALSCVVKWPAFRYGALYASATGDTLLDGYRYRGRWTLVVFGLMTLAICFTTLAAVTAVTAGLMLNLLPDGVETWLAGLTGPLGSVGPVAVVSILILGLIATGLATGGYRLLEGTMKVVMPVLALATILAAIVAIPALVRSGFGDPQELGEPAGRALAASMIGWMPAPIDIAVWSSIWTLARVQSRGARGTKDQILLDFDAGYLATLVLAIGFAALGAGVMHGQGLEFENGPAAFAGQVVDLYASQLGGWTWPIVATAAFLTMLSTTVTVADGFPRTIAGIIEAWQRPLPKVVTSGRKGKGASVPAAKPRHVPTTIMDAIADSIERYESLSGRLLPPPTTPAPPPKPEPPMPKATLSPVAYWSAFGAVAFGAILVLFGALDSAGVGFTTLIDLVTTVSFLVAPVLVVFNHLCVNGAEVPEADRPSTVWQAWSWTAILATSIFAAYYAFMLIQPWLVSLAVAPPPAG